MSFRLKLVLAMLVVVIGATGATVLVLQRDVEGTYARISSEHFRTDVNVLAALRAARLAVPRSRCLDLATSVRLIAAIGEHDTALLYRTAADELRNLFQPPHDSPEQRAATFFRFVGADGAVLSPPDARAGLVGTPDAPRWEAQLAAAMARLPADDSQQVGYLAPDVNGEPTLTEVVVTRLVDRAMSRQLGALAVGFPLDDHGTRPGPRDIRGGIWLEGRLYAPDLPAAARQTLATTMESNATDPGPLQLIVGGVPQRVFRQPIDSGSGFPPTYQVGLYPMDEAIARERQLRRRALGFGALGLLAALALSLVMSQSLAVPIRELVAAAGAVSRGDLGVTVPVRSRDEVGRLATSFNAMVEELALKQRYRSVLGLLAEKEVARELIEGRLSLGGELREASIVFCDIRGFTTLTEKMAPPEVIELLNEHMGALTRVVHAHGGVVDKFVGDSLIAVFGVPRSSAHDAERAVRAAEEMIATRVALNRTARHRLKVGIGIASGAVVAGCVGSAERLNYTVLGARVNLAARLCQHARGMEVLVDDDTRRQSGDPDRFEPVAPLGLKGFSAPVHAHRLVLERETTVAVS